ncbi:hypothetical protein THICB2_850007 [Thiomonas sp. CB2]|nr:hypothetical protein THICB2_850007 [Thiomonas sp. CB2]CQR41351.1 hypothetical protein THICB3100038 [Thiomonas sp. CB3]VDY04317.1 protein of unknown function [Thiomonas sp. Bio17B3]VDY10498.1 protein of unknown function [Thiomonas sp. Sup16B3]VDY06205.1 protein of unknown function [Thiomonas sp. Bio17B3]
MVIRGTVDAPSSILDDVLATSMSANSALHGARPQKIQCVACSHHPALRVLRRPSVLSR